MEVSEPEGSVHGEQGREAQFAQPILDALTGRSRQRRSAFVAPPSARAQVVVGTEQLEESLGDAFVHVEEGTQRGIESFDSARCAVALHQ